MNIGVRTKTPDVPACAYHFRRRVRNIPKDSKADGDRPVASKRAKFGAGYQDFRVVQESQKPMSETSGDRHKGGLVDTDECDG